MSETPETDAPAKRDESGVDPYCRLLARSRKIERERDLLKKRLAGLDLLLAAILLRGRNVPLAPHHRAAIREYLDDPSEGELMKMIQEGRR